MTAVWDLPDFDNHEGVHIFRDHAAGLTAIVLLCTRLRLARRLAEHVFGIILILWRLSLMRCAFRVG